MPDKKRKVAAPSVEVPAKKSKKSTSVDGPSTTKVKGKPAKEHAVVKTATKTPPAPVSVEPTVATTSKKSRKRAADFMLEDDELQTTELPAAVPAKKSKASKSGAQENVAAAEKKKSKKTKASKKGDLLSADGVNGVIEHSGEEDPTTATANTNAALSMQAEAERTVDHELEDEFGDEDDNSDNEVALLAGFDSDGDDDAEDTGDLSQTPGLPQSKKTRKKLEKAKTSGKTEPGTVYVGRIPHGFYETEMREYFSQFGEITQLRLSRNKRTGQSKHFAFVEFASDEVAKIVAETMDNYLLFGHILKCKYAPAESLHPDVWKGANKKFRKIPHDKIEREKLAAPKSVTEWEKKVKKEQRKREKKAKQLKAIGLDMPKSTLTNPASALLVLENGDSEAVSAPTGALEPPPMIPKDAVAMQHQKKRKKSKKESASADYSAAVPAKADVLERGIVDAMADVLPAVKKAKKGKKDQATDVTISDVVPTIPVVKKVKIPAEAPAATKPQKDKKTKKTAEVPVVDVEAPVAPKKAKKAKKAAAT